MGRGRYDWKRFWCPRNGTIAFDGGYLADPDGDYGFALNPDLQTFDQLADTPVLVLLGEPGSGKSTAMADAYSTTAILLEPSIDQCLSFDLATFQTDYLLVEKVFNGPEFAAWRDGTHRMHLFLDSLDECRLRIESVANLLLGELRDCPTTRLSLRIACRSADWPAYLEGGLRELWDGERCGVATLAPLRSVDVESAAHSNNLDGAAFLNAVETLNVVAFATRPVTLEFLVRSFAREQALPSSQVELYLKGCRLLCEESSDSRRAAGQIGQLQADARIVVASRLAAIMVFSNRNAIWKGIDRGDVPEGDVTIAELIGGQERAAGSDCDVRESVVREVLETGLFTDAGPERLSFVHRTYAEFLAAYYVKRRDLDLQQAVSLVIGSNDPERKIVPQLLEAAAWLACQIPEMFDELVLSDPVALASSDVLVSEESAKSALLDGLLRSYDTGDQPDYPALTASYNRLCHKDLAQQLRPYIQDASHQLIAQRAAAEIAGMCEVGALQEELADVALDPTRPLTVRLHAAVAVGCVGNETTRGRLKALALEPLDDDPDDELKGAALRAVWPDLVTANELFTAITWPKRDNLIGLYSGFLNHWLLLGLRPEEIPTALAWACEIYDPDRRYLGPVGHLIDSLVEYALKHTSVSGVLPPLGMIVLAKLEHHDPILPDKIFSGSKREELRQPERRDLLGAIVAAIEDPQRQCPRIVMARPQVLFSEDVFWMVEQLEQTPDVTKRLAWSNLIRFALNFSDPAQVDAVLMASGESEELAESFSDLLESIDLDSEKAKATRDLHNEIQRLEAGTSAVSSNVGVWPPIQQRILPLLEKIDKGEPEYYANIDTQLSIDVEQQLYVGAFDFDVTAFPGWKELDRPLQDRVVDAAETYLRETSPRMDDWPEKHTRGSLAGSRAFVLLRKEATERFVLLPDALWTRWLPALLGHPILDESSGHEALLEILGLAYKHVPGDYIATLKHHVRVEAESKGRISTTAKLDCCWNDELANVLLEIVRDPDVEPDAAGELLETLVAHAMQEAIAFGITAVGEGFAVTVKTNPHALVCARVLLTHAPRQSWTVVWPAVSSDTELAKEVLRAAVAREGGLGKVLSDLSEDQLADLYVWFASYYPHATDPQGGGVRTVGPDDQLRDFRDAILNTLKSRGTEETCAAIERIREELPQLDWLRWSLAEARETMRSRMWVPASPKEILALAQNRNARLVRDPEELLETVKESLLRLEMHFRGETPITFSLWDRIDETSYRPKPEEAFTDFVKWHLENDLRERGIVLNREVQIRRGESQRKGQRTDIHIDALATDVKAQVYDRFTVIVEAKGSWHKELYTAMKTQLVERYLAENPCKYGLYLVGWFDGSLRDGKPDGAWTPGESIQEARARLDNKARELSKNLLHVEALIIDVSLTDPGPMKEPAVRMVRRHGK